MGELEESMVLMLLELGRFADVDLINGFVGEDVPEITDPRRPRPFGATEVQVKRKNHNNRNHNNNNSRKQTRRKLS